MKHIPSVAVALICFATLHSASHSQGLPGAAPGLNSGDVDYILEMPLVPQPVRTFYDSAKCNTRVHTHWIPGFQKVLEEALNEPDKEKRKMLLYGDYFTRTLWAVTYSGQNMAQCFECMRVCPAAHGLKPLR